MMPGETGDHLAEPGITVGLLEDAPNRRAILQSSILRALGTLVDEDHRALFGRCQVLSQPLQLVAGHEPWIA